MLCWPGSQQKGKMSYLGHFKRHWVLSWGNWMELSIFINSKRNTRIWNWISVSCVWPDYVNSLHDQQRKMFPGSLALDVYVEQIFLQKILTHSVFIKGGAYMKACMKTTKGRWEKCQLHCVLFFYNIFLLVQIRSVEFTGKSLNFNEKNSRSKDTSKSVLLL